MVRPSGAPESPAPLREMFEHVLAIVTTAARHHYGERLVALAVFGSVGRGTPRPGSDLDLLVVAQNLPTGRLARVADFQPVETLMRAAQVRPAWAGLSIECSPVFKTPAEVEAGSPLFLDMTEDARLLYDRDGFLRLALDRLKDRLSRLGATRIRRGSAWLWDLKPDYKPGETFEL